MEHKEFFATPASFSEWLAENSTSAKVLWLCYYKKHTGKASITWPESVAEALCYGWIDGLRKSIDDEAYMIRFTPRKKDSIWSRKNIDTVEALIKAKKMTPAGLAAYQLLDQKKSAIYTYENKPPELSPAFLKLLKADKGAWNYFERIAPSAKKTMIGWVMSAKREQTQMNRLNSLIESCRSKQLIPALRWRKKKG